MRTDTWGFLFAAQNDYIGARVLFRRSVLFPAGLLAHQCSEKALKAILVENGYSLDDCRNRLRHDLVMIGGEVVQFCPSFADSHWTDFFARIGKGFQFRYMDSLQDYATANASNLIISADDACLLDNLLGDVHKALGLSDNDLVSLPLHGQLKDDKDLAHLIMKHNKRVPDLFATNSFKELVIPEDPEFALPNGLGNNGDVVHYVIYEPCD